MAEVKWTNEQLQAIQEKNSNILVAAAAGSGKTAVLVERIIHKIIDEQMDIDKILVVTFTNAAASEMRERILEAIYKKLEENPENVHLQRQIILLNKASICTIHSFCLDVIHNHFYEIDLPSNFKIADTAEIDLLKQEVLDDLFEQKYTENDKNFIELLENYTNYRGDEALQELVLKIYKFIQSSPFPIKWLQEKLELLKIKDKDISQTIWGKLIIQTVDDDIQESIMQLEVTKSKMALYPEMTKFYQTISEDIINLQDLQKYNSWDELYIKLLNFNFSKWPVDKKVINDLKEDSKEIRDKVKKHIKEKTAKLLSCSQEQAVKDLKIITPILEKLSNLVTEFTKNFAEKKKEKNCIDFNDIEHFALKILLDENNNPTEVAKKYKEKFEEIAIDEYQDSNLVQEAILTSISKGNNIFMVGDVKQSIYKFRQARPELFLQKYDEYKNKEEKAQEDNLKIHLSYMDCPKTDINSTLTKVGLENVDLIPVSKYSLGMKQRLAIARAIIHNPHILLLDEPINGLDPLGIKQMRSLVLSLSKESGMTIIISSHILSEIEQIADTIGIIKNGTIIEEIQSAEILKDNAVSLEDYYFSKMEENKNA